MILKGIMKKLKKKKMCYFTKKIINLKNEDKGFDAIDMILNDKNFLKMEDNLEDDKKNK